MVALGTACEQSASCSGRGIAKVKENSLPLSEARPNFGFPSMAKHLQIEADQETATILGQKLGSLLFPNAVIALIGPLGAGKTYLSRAIAEGLDIARASAVTSPTFVLIQEYPNARLPIYHFDTYRLPGSNEFQDLGVEEYFQGGGVCLIEWADRVEDALPNERLTIRIVPLSENHRQFFLEAEGGVYEEILEKLQPEILLKQI
jgi:tRNA threonylcarbamoyladenosine biosynthesis protein TsaE